MRALITLGLMLTVFAAPARAEEPDAPAEKASRPIVGWVEHVRLEPWGLRTRGRIDTGAKTSSLSARDIQPFERDEQRWVRFTFDFQEDRNKPYRAIELELPVARVAKIKRHNNQIQERPVVNMDLCINNQVHNVEFTLIDRRGLNYALLLGRRALKDIGLVDPTVRFLTRADCGHKKKKKKAKPAAAESP